MTPNGKDMNSSPSEVDFEDALKKYLQQEEMNQLMSFSVLIKRLTCLQSTNERLKTAFRAFGLILKTNVSTTIMPPINWTYCQEIIQFVSMIHKFTRGWDTSEFPTVLSALTRRFNLQNHLDSFLNSNNRNEVCVGSEMRLRLIFRCLVWDCAGVDYNHRGVIINECYIIYILNQFNIIRIG